MKFLNLTIDNFMPIGHAELKLDGRGLVLLQGINKDDTSSVSNGAGKSTIPDSLCWALYGTTARGETGDAIVNNTAKKDTQVSVVLQDGASVYKITRYRKHTKMKNAVILEAVDPIAGTTTNLTRGTSDETDAEILKIIGCSLEVFAAAIYCGQRKMPDIPGMTDKQLKLLVEQAAGIERIEAAYRVALAKKAETERQLQLAVVAHNNALANQIRLGGEVLTLEDDAKKWAENQVERIRAIEASLDSRRAIFSAKAGIVKGYDKAGIEGKLATARASLASWQTTQASLKTLRQGLSSATNEVTRAEADARVKAAKVKELREHVDLLQKNGPGACSSCGQNLPHSQHGDHVRRKIADLTFESGVFKTAMDALTLKRASAAAIQSQIEDLEKVPAPAVLLKEISDLEEQLREIESKTAELRRLVEDQKREEAQLVAVKAEVNPIAAVLTRAVAAQKDAVQKKHDTQKAMLDREAELAIAEDCVKVFGPAGVRAHILDTVTPFLNDRTAHYLTVLSDGNIQAVWTTLTRNKAGDLKEKFSIEVTNAKGGKSYGLQSGGQAVKVQLACILALQDLVASRATKPIDLWIGDEIDDALDTAGLERLMAILESRARERGTVLVVSHNELRDWIDDVTTITLEGGFSKVEGALCA